VRDEPQLGTGAGRRDPVARCVWQLAVRGLPGACTPCALSNGIVCHLCLMRRSPVWACSNRPDTYRLIEHVRASSCLQLSHFTSLRNSTFQTRAFTTPVICVSVVLQDGVVRSILHAATEEIGYEQAHTPATPARSAGRFEHIRRRTSLPRIALKEIMHHDESTQVRV
jgi:hypothetical protein